MAISMINTLIVIIIGAVLTAFIILKIHNKSRGCSELIKKCIDEVNKDWI